MTFRIYTAQDAPKGTRKTLHDIEKKKGFVPNMVGVMAGAPAMLEAFTHLENCMQATSLSEIERDIVLMTVSGKNQSKYCMDAQTCAAEKHGLSSVEMQALRNGRPLNDARHEALRQYTLGVMENHGRPPDETKDRFIAAGYGPQQALEIVLGIAYKTMTNYAWRLAHPPVDSAFETTVLELESAA